MRPPPRGRLRYDLSFSDLLTRQFTEHFNKGYQRLGNKIFIGFFTIISSDDHRLNFLTMGMHAFCNAYNFSSVDNGLMFHGVTTNTRLNLGD